MADDHCLLDMLIVAEHEGGIYEWLILRAREKMAAILRDHGATHFRHRYGGPRNQYELMRELRGYLTPV